MAGPRIHPERKISEERAFEQGRRNAERGLTGSPPYTDLRSAEAFRR
jgi:hypothetical protein